MLLLDLDLVLVITIIISLWCDDVLYNYCENCTENCYNT